MKFDVVVGNPPYQDGAYQLYANFYRMSIQIGNEVSLIFPTSWQLPKNKNGLSLLNNSEVKHDPQIVSINNVEGAFPGITGVKWTNIILWKRGYNNNLDGKQLLYTNGENPEVTELIIDDYLYGKPKEILGISDRVEHSAGFASIFDQIYLQNKFDLKAVFAEFPDLKVKVASGGKEKRLRTNIFESLPEVFDVQDNGGELLIHGLDHRTRSSRFIKREFIQNHKNLDKWKVLIPKAVTVGFGEKITEPLVVGPGQGYTETFLGFGAFDTEQEAENMKKYVKTKFARTLLGVLKMTQDTAPDKWKKVPVQDYSANSDIDWDVSVSELGAQLYVKYDLSKQDIDFIENNVKPME